MPRRLGSVVTVIAAIIVFAAGSYVISKNDPVRDAGTTPTLPGTTLSNSAGATGSRSTPNATAVVAFVGDDYTASTGASRPSNGFTSLLAGSLAITAKTFGEDRAGYAMAGADHRTFIDQVGAVVAANPDVIVVSGGRNDVVDDMATLATAATTLFAELHQRLPRATLVVISPWWGDSDHPAELQAIAASVKSAVKSAGGIYLDLPDPLHRHPEFMADKSDPNDAGYAAIAAALQPKLAALMPGCPGRCHGGLDQPRRPKTPGRTP